MSDAQQKASRVEAALRGGPTWNLADKKIQLLKPEELVCLPAGTVLYSIMGERVVVGTDYIDDDTRMGYIAYGIEV